MPKKKKAKKAKILKKTKISKIKTKVKPGIKTSEKKAVIVGPDEKPEIKLQIQKNK